MNFSKLPIVLLLSGLVQVHSHGVGVYSCLSTSGNLRIFIEHWHGSLSSASSAGTMTVTKDNLNVTFCNDCVFNQKTEEKYEKTNQLYDRPTYVQVATRSSGNKQRMLR